MFDIYVDEVMKIFMSSFRYTVSFCANNPERWDDTLKKCSYVPVEYTYHSLAYQEEYIRQIYNIIINMSVIVAQNGEDICLWPVTCVINDSYCWFSTNEKEVCPPIFVSGITHKVKNHVINDAMEAIKRVYDYLLQKGFILKPWQSRCNLLIEQRDSGVNEWYRRCKEEGGETDVITNLYVDLGMDLELIHSNIRKHYKALINKADRLWNSEVLVYMNDEEIELFRNKHIEVAGRETRSHETWLCQQKSVNSGNGFVIKLTDRLSGQMVGESLFEISRDEGLYSVGVYDRDLYDEPVSHIVQWKAIEYMKQIGLKKYRIGQRFYSGKGMHIIEPTEKELSISYFKEGFATEHVHTLIVTNPLE